MAPCRAPVVQCLPILFFSSDGAFHPVRHGLGVRAMYDETAGLGADAPFLSNLNMDPRIIDQSSASRVGRFASREFEATREHV